MLGKTKVKYDFNFYGQTFKHFVIKLSFSMSSKFLILSIFYRTSYTL